MWELILVRFLRLKEMADDYKKGELKSITRLASKEDLEKANINKAQKEEMVKYCRSLVKKHSLPMKNN